MYQNYIFDLYGTLIDIKTNENSPYLWKKLADFFSAAGAFYTNAALKKRYNELCLSCKKSHPETYYDLDITTVFATLYSEKGLDASQELIGMTASLFRILSRSRFALYDGVISLFDQIHAKGGKVYLLSNAQASFTVPELKQCKIYDSFDGIVISSDVSYCKPDSRIMEQLLLTYHLDPAQSIMIGNDRRSDICIAEKFHMDSLLLVTDPHIEELATKDPAKKISATFEIPDGDFTKIADILFS